MLFILCAILKNISSAILLGQTNGLSSPLDCGYSGFFRGRVYEQSVSRGISPITSSLGIHHHCFRDARGSLTVLLNTY